MKIAYDHQIFSGQKYGGISKYYYQLINNISKTENKVRIFSPIHRNFYIQSLPKGVVKGIKVNGYPFGPMGDRLVTEVNRVLLKPFLRSYKPDIIHQTYFNSYKKSDIPTVLTVYDLIHEKFHLEYGKNSNYRPKKSAIANADQIICISGRGTINLPPLEINSRSR